jgi:hypothetical protein
LFLRRFDRPETAATPQRRIDWPSLMRLPDESELRFREGDLRGLHVSFGLKDVEPVLYANRSVIRLSSLRCYNTGHERLMMA